MVQSRQRSGLVLEARPPIRVVGNGIGQDLDRNRTSQPRVVRAIHLAHPAGTEQRLDGEGAEPASGRKALHVR